MLCITLSRWGQLLSDPMCRRHVVLSPKSPVAPLPAYLLICGLSFIAGDTTAKFVETVRTVHFSTFSTRRHDIISIFGWCDVACRTAELGIIVHGVPPLVVNGFCLLSSSYYPVQCRPYGWVQQKQIHDKELCLEPGQSGCQFHGHTHAFFDFRPGKGPQHPPHAYRLGFFHIHLGG